MPDLSGGVGAFSEPAQKAGMIFSLRGVYCRVRTSGIAMQTTYRSTLKGKFLRHSPLSCVYCGAVADYVIRDPVIHHGQADIFSG